ncbi:MAG: DNA polymerase II large subunit [Candidatus Bathyarchaeia archaeon]
MDRLGKQFEAVFSLAQQARSLGLDPSPVVEAVVAADLAERVEKSVGPPGISSRIRELMKRMPWEEVAFKVAEELAQTFSKVGEEAAADQAIRTALAILGEGVTVAPIQGISSVRVKTNHDNSRYLAIYFAGPIRSAGGTEMALILVVADYIQQLMGLSRYRATEIEARRFVEELRLYEREVSRFQFKVSDQELYDVVMNLPVEVNGVQTDQVEVASFRNLPRIETNGVRGGALRVVNDGLVGRAQKVVKIVDKLGISGWSWLRNLAPRATEAEEARDFMYLEDVVGGRPIFSMPATDGGFRLRYGRSRNTGLAALGIHPSTMHILRDFIATGTQLRIEKPGKAGVVAPVESIEPPIVRLADGSVHRVDDPKFARKVADSVTDVLFLGDILVSFGEFIENNKPLAPSGFVEEWWSTLLEQAIESRYRTAENASGEVGIDPVRLNSFLKDPLAAIPTPAEALRLSRTLGVPLHPRYTYRWNNLNPREIDELRAGLLNSLVTSNVSGRVVLRNLDNRTKALLERLWVPHEVAGEEVIIPEGEILRICLGLDGEWRPPNGDLSGLDYISKASGVTLQEKAATFIGARMGRPEKAKRREMKPAVNCLFPVGLAGGARRNIVEAARNNTVVSVDIEKRECPSCHQFTHTNKCLSCNTETILIRSCPRCGASVEERVCPLCGVSTVTYEKRPVNIRLLLESAAKKLGMTPPEVVRCVRGMTSDAKKPEPLEKGLLRARYGLSVFKDGTTRFDATNAPLTHFKPAEVGLPLERALELGYERDSHGDPLTSTDQMCMLNVQDIIIPEVCADYFINVSLFLDELLKKFYGLRSYYNIKKREDLIGHLAVGLSPHTSVGVLGRIIGFTKASVCLAHPFWHAAKRRDCDGDEDAIMLLLDVLLNFSRSFLPSKIGGLMDAPLLLTIYVNPNEVARQAFNIEVVDRLPLKFFQEAGRRSASKSVTDIVPTIVSRLDREDMYMPVGFTHNIEDINSGNLESSYKRLPSMLTKIQEQLKLAGIVKAVASQEVARKVVATHLMRDLVGNLKAFSSQRFRCSRCNTRYRRIPLRGVCQRCNSKLNLTVHRGAIQKYLGIAERLVKDYKIGVYYEQWLKMISEEIDSLFREKGEEKQPELIDFM